MNLSVTADRTTAVIKRFTRVSGIWESGSAGLDARVRVPASSQAAAHPTPDSAGGLTYTAVRSDGANAVYHWARGASGPIQLVETPPAFAGRFYDVNADGDMIVCSDAKTPHGLYRIRNDGSDTVRLLDSDANVVRLTPEGKTVLFTRFGTAGLHSIPTAGGSVKRLTSAVVPPRPGFSVSPDGSRVLIGTDKAGTVGLCNLPDCTALAYLALPSSLWAPDGLGVAYVANATTIMEQPLTGGPPRPLARLEGERGDLELRVVARRFAPRHSRGRYPNDMVIIKDLR